MTSTQDPSEQARREFDDWLTRRAQNRWPGSRVRYRGRARRGSHWWEIKAPGVGAFWLAADPAVLSGPNAVRNATDVLDTVASIERLPDVPTRALIIRHGGRVLGWDPAEDDTIGLVS